MSITPEEMRRVRIAGLKATIEDMDKRSKTWGSTTSIHAPKRARLRRELAQLQSENEE
jgi:hypothetical protein